LTVRSVSPPILEFAMQCSECGLNEAAVHLTQIVNNEVTSLRLCESCAAAKGVEIGAPELGAAAPLTDFLAQLGKSLSGEAVQTVVACPNCGLSMADLKRTGRLGCAGCYPHFAGHLRHLLRRLHGGTQHVGKQHVPGDGPEPGRGSEIRTLRRSLARAIETEDFERAAQIRDQIRELESSGTAGEAS
jgi:protein arginine kinase activator